MRDLMGLRMACILASGPDTSYELAEYKPTVSPLHQHCGAVSYVVKLKYGGELVSYSTSEGRHIWNLLPDGTEVDLTSDQYGGDGINPLPTYAGKGKKLPARRTVNPRFNLFADKVDYHLGVEPLAPLTGWTPEKGV